MVSVVFVDDNSFELTVTSGNPDDIVSKIALIISDLKGKSAKKLAILCPTLSEDQALQLLAFLGEEEQNWFTLDIDLPQHLQNTRCQIGFDNLVSNYRQQKNRHLLNHSEHSLLLPTPTVSKVARTLPDKITPKVVITYFMSDNIEGLYLDDMKTVTINSPGKQQRNQETNRSPIPEQVLGELFQHQQFASLKQEWEACSERQQALKFRQQRLFSADSVTLHPLNYLLQGHEELQQQLQRWTKKLHFDVMQYNALLDVYAQYGAAGLNKLFAIWDGYNEHQLKAFLNLYPLLLQEMPTYVPFVNDPQFNEQIKAIANLNTAHYSWWMVLLNNHILAQGEPKDLFALFNLFTEKVRAIEALGLTFSTIKNMKECCAMPEAFSKIIALLERCDRDNGDRGKQWACIDSVPFSQMQGSFYLPVMEKQSPLADLEAVKKLFKDKKSCSLEEFEPAFYRYLATRKQRLSLNHYQEFLHSLAQESRISERIKMGMAYILAKTTTTDDDFPLDTEAVIGEWRSFEQRLVEIKYLERLRANRSTMALLAFNAGVSAGGGDDGVRVQVFEPLLDMEVIPLLSYLNKLLKLSEYPFLDPNIDILGLQQKQKELMKTMAQAAAIYQKYPQTSLQAIRLIKTEEVLKNKDGKYFPQPKDVHLLEQFIEATNLLTADHPDLAGSDELHLKNTLFPLLTVFHLEYDEHGEDIKAVIASYKQQINSLKDDPHRLSLFLYGVSLLQSIQKRAINEVSLNAERLIHIQQNLLGDRTTRQQIREWLDEQYGAFFGTSKILKTNDLVNIDDHLTSIGCDQPEIREAITLLVSHFNLPNEEPDRNSLVTSLAELAKTLTIAQAKILFHYYHQELQEEGLFQRSLQSVPPTLLQQFKSLIELLTTQRSFEELERFLTLVQDAKNNPKDNCLGKSIYLLNTLYPVLMERGMARKEAFNFAAHLCCYSSFSATREVHQNSQSISKKAFTNIQAFLKSEISSFNNLESVTKANLQTLIKMLQVVIALKAEKETFFRECRTIIKNIQKIIDRIDQSEKEYKEQWLTGKLIYMWNNTSYGYSPVATPAEVQVLKDQLAQLDDENSATFQEIKAIDSRFVDIAIHLQQKKKQVLTRYSNIAERVEDFISKALALSTDNIAKKHDDTVYLVENFLELDDQNLVLSLMYHYSGGYYGHVADLISLFNHGAYKSLSSPIRKAVINAIISQMNNGIECSEQDIHSFLKYIKHNASNRKIIQHLKEYYQHAPFPSLATFMHWNHDNHVAYEQFDRNPCGQMGRESDNGFHLNFARKLVKMMPEVESIFSETYLQRIKNAAEQAKTKSTAELITTLKNLKNTPPVDHSTLVMYLAELLHRSKGLPPKYNCFGQPISGRSFELNTTQIIALLAMLEKGPKITAEIGTGEGKTRIMMMMNACQFLKGKRVNFLTSNLALAERDYLQALPFFQSLGAQVNFIRADSRIEDYEHSDIIYSDTEQFSLFCCKASSQNKVLNPDPEKQVVVLDEADVTYFTNSIKYNVSSSVAADKKKLLPIYPLLMEFFAQEDSEQLYREDTHRCTERLLCFIERSNEELGIFVRSLSDNQLQQLQDAAYTARRYQYNQDYTIITEAVMPTALGEKKVAAAMCRVNSRININGHFDGVHQCLHAELNRLMNSADLDRIDNDLKKALQKCKAKKRTFAIKAELEITSSSSANQMLKDYAEGGLYAVTGTIGSTEEQEEARSIIGTQFIRVPRHKGLHRYDAPTRICATDEAQLVALREHIAKSQKNNQPVLIFCRDDRESQELYEQLKLTMNAHQMKRLHAATDYEDDITEAEYINTKAGQPGQITITTEMAGRGIDIELHGRAHDSGLKVLSTYPPEGERDWIQIIGRAGRYGTIGETQMVLSLEALKKDLGINHFNADFYRYPEAFIKEQQRFSAYTKRIHRLFTHAFEDFLRIFKQQYEQLNDIKEHWPQFLTDCHLIQEQSESAIKVELEKAHPNAQTIDNILQEYADKIGQYWQKYISPELVGLPTTIKPPFLLVKWLDALKKLSAFTAPIKVKKIIRVPVFPQEDKALAGRPHLVLSNKGRAWFANFRAWLRGEGILFPNTKAWWAGELSFRNWLSQLPILSWFIKPREERYERIVEVPSTYAELFHELAASERLQHFKKLVQELKENPLAAMERWKEYLEQNQLNEEEKAYCNEQIELAKVQDPENSFSKYLNAWLLLFTEKNKAGIAKEICEQAIRENDNDLEFYFLLADIHSGLAGAEPVYVQAEKLYLKLVQEKSNARGAYLLAQMHDKGKTEAYFSYAEAYKYYEITHQLDPNYIPPILHLAEMHHAEKYCREVIKSPIMAVNYYLAALKLGYTKAYYHLGLLYQNMVPADYAQAIYYHQQALRYGHQESLAVLDQLFKIEQLTDENRLQLSIAKLYAYGFRLTQTDAVKGAKAIDLAQTLAEETTRLINSSSTDEQRASHKANIHHTLKSNRGSRFFGDSVGNLVEEISRNPTLKSK